jgi:phosphate transport system substrate-binding protein
VHRPYLSRRIAVFCACFGLSLAALPAAAADAPVEIVIGGTGAALGAMKALGDAYTAATPQARVRTIASLGSGGGIKALAAGAIQVAVTSRPLTDDERAKGLVERELIRTPFVFAVHQKAPVTQVSLAEVAEIYAGSRASWKDGTKTRPILPPGNRHRQ